MEKESRIGLRRFISADREKMTEGIEIFPREERLKGRETKSV